jgi:glycerol-3-phosphate acyltransferase PlsY
MKILSDIFLVIAAIASMVLSALGFSVGAWSGFWGGAGVGAVLDVSVWLVPTLSVFAFVTYLISKPVGLRCSWGVALATVITSIWSLASGEFSMIIFLFPTIQLIACFALYGDARIRSKIAQNLATQ